TARFRNFYTLSPVPLPSNWTPPLHNFWCTASLPPTHLLISATISPPTTLGLHSHSNPDGYVLRNNASARKRQRLLSPPPALRHRTFYSKLVYLPFPLHSALSAACALVPTPSAATASNSATTPSNAPSRPPAAGALNHTQLGNIPVPQEPATRVAISAHTLRHCVPTAAAPTKHIQPHAANIQFQKGIPVKRMVRRMRCIWLTPLKSISVWKLRIRIGTRCPVSRMTYMCLREFGCLMCPTGLLRRPGRKGQNLFPL